MVSVAYPAFAYSWTSSITPAFTLPGRVESIGTTSERAAGERYKLPVTYLHSVWGRMVPEIPAFRRELVAALAES